MSYGKFRNLEFSSIADVKLSKLDLIYADKLNELFNALKLNREQKIRKTYEIFKEIKYFGKTFQTNGLNKNLTDNLRKCRTDKYFKNQKPSIELSLYQGSPNSSKIEFFKDLELKTFKLIISILDVKKEESYIEFYGEEAGTRISGLYTNISRILGDLEKLL